VAEFSREYCESYDFEGFSDFSVEEIFEGLEEGYYFPIICEGYGFLGISRRGGECHVAFPKGGETGKTVWKKFSEVTDETHKQKHI